MTVLLAELDRPRPAAEGAAGALGGEVVTRLVTAAGGTVEGEAPGERGRVVRAHFPLAHEGLRAAMAVVGAAPARLALCTGEVDGGDPAPPVGARAADLLRAARPGQVLATASTVVMAGEALPPGVTVIHRGLRPLGPRARPERYYELRSRPDGPGPPGAADDDGGASNLGWAHRAAPASVLGREEAFARLDEAWQATRHGRPRVVLLCGEAGIGKTTVAAELALRLQAQGALVLHGRWDPGHGAPYQAIREALGSYAAASPAALLAADLEGRVDEIARLLPEVGARVGGGGHPEPGDPERDRLALFDAIAGWLRCLGTRRPVLVVLDDLHWAGHSSRLLLDHLRDTLDRAPVMIVAAARDGELDAAAPLPPERVELAGLDRSAVGRLVEQAIGRSPGDDVVGWLARGTVGNPLFVQEMLHGLPEDGTAALAALGAARRAVPSRLADAVGWRVAQLPGATADALAAASVVGPRFDLDLVAEAAGRPPVALTGPLDQALRAGLLRRAAPAGHYGFAHDVVHRALEATLPPERATTLHRRVAIALAGRVRGGEPVPPGQVAHHHLRGADADTAADAVRAAVTAAEAARRETDFEAAVELLTSAVAVHGRWAPGEGGGDALVACELRLALAEACDRAGQFVPRDRWFADAADRSRALDRTDLLVRAVLGYGGRLPAAPPPNPAARRLLDEALARLPAADSASRALVLARLAEVGHLDTPRARRRHRAGEAVAMARRLGDPPVLARVLMARAMALDGPDDVEDQLATAAEVEAIGRSTGDRDLVLQGHRLRMPALLSLGRSDEARRVAGAFGRMAREEHHPDHLRLNLMWDGLWKGLEGDHAAAEEQAAALHRQLVAAGHPQTPMLHFAQTFGTRWMQGRLEESRPVLDVLRAADPGGPLWWSLAGWLEAATGHEDRARAQLARHDPAAYVAGLDRGFLWWPTVVACAVTATLVEAEAWAPVLHDALAPYADRHAVLGYVAFMGAVDHHLGTLDLVAGRPGPAVDRLERGLDRHRRLGAGPWEVLSTRWLAQALRRRGRAGDGDRAGELAAAGDAAARGLDLRGWPRPPG